MAEKLDAKDAKIAILTRKWSSERSLLSQAKAFTLAKAAKAWLPPVTMPVWLL